MKLMICKPFRRISAIPRRELNFSAELNKMIIQFICQSGHDIDIWTNVSDRDDTLSFFEFNIPLINIEDNWHKINDFDYDAIIIISSTPNWYGGCINDNFLKIYQIR